MCATMEKLRICEIGVMLGVLAGFGGWSSWDWSYGDDEGLSEYG